MTFVFDSGKPGSYHDVGFPHSTTLDDIVGALGDKLRRAREARGVSFDEIALATKIGTRSLKAIEAENFSVLPGGIFNKGFVRAYARFLGVNEEEAVRLYQAAAVEQPLSVETVAAQSLKAHAGRIAQQKARQSRDLKRRLLFVGVSVTLVFAGLGSYRFATRFTNRHNAPSLSAPQVVKASTPTPAPMATVQPAAVVTPATSSTPVQPDPVSPAAPAEFTVTVKTTGPSWLSATADGKRAFRRMFSSNEEQVITARNKVRIDLGNPMATELLVNGKQVALEGELHNARRLVIDPSGVTRD